jgi:acetoin utilization protein AcuC
VAFTLYYGEELADYNFGAAHPFGPDRLDAFWKETLARGLDRRVEIAPPQSCTEEALLRFHTPDYVARVQQQSKTGAGLLDYGDTPAFPGVYEATCRVVGTGLAAAGRILAAGERAFVPIAGLHHARRDRAGGFCVFNDIGVIIEQLRAVHGIARFAYVDIDAHHGDGVYYSYADDPQVYIADMHEDGRYLYPGTGRADETGTGEAAGTKLNIPLPPNADDDTFRREWPRVEELVRAARPEFILLQAGADSILGDPITHLALSPASHRIAAERLRVLADELCDGRLLGLGGGGYNRSNLARAWNEVVEAWVD